MTIISNIDNYLLTVLNDYNDNNINTSYMLCNSVHNYLIITMTISVTIITHDYMYISAMTLSITAG